VARLDGPIRATVDLTVEPLAQTRSRRDMTFVRRPPGWQSPPVHVTATQPTLGHASAVLTLRYPPRPFLGTWMPWRRTLMRW